MTVWTAWSWQRGRFSLAAVMKICLCGGPSAVLQGRCSDLVFLTITARPPGCFHWKSISDNLDDNMITWGPPVEETPFWRVALSRFAPIGPSREMKMLADILKESEIKLQDGFKLGTSLLAKMWPNKWIINRAYGSFGLFLKFVIAILAKWVEHWADWPTWGWYRTALRFAWAPVSLLSATRRPPHGSSVAFGVGPSELSASNPWLGVFEAVKYSCCRMP